MLTGASDPQEFADWWTPGSHPALFEFMEVDMQQVLFASRCPAANGRGLRCAEYELEDIYGSARVNWTAIFTPAKSRQWGWIRLVMGLRM